MPWRQRRTGGILQAIRYCGLQHLAMSYPDEPEMPPQTHEPPLLDELWRAPSLIALVLAGEGLALLLALAPGPRLGITPMVYFGLASLMVQWIVLLALSLAWALRRPLTRLSPGQNMAALLAILLFATWAAVAGIVLTGSATLLAATASGWSLFWRLSAMALTVGLLSLAALQMVWRNRRLAVAAEQARRAALQARIRPHFLFNTLNTGAALVRIQPESAEHLLLDLADLFRAALSDQRSIPLAEEIELARRYLAIEQLRFGERLRVRWNLPEPLPQADVPPLSLQPLVENAIRHGIEQSSSAADIEIGVDVDHDRLHLWVRNPVPAVDSPVRGGHGIGLAAARARLAAHDASAHLYSECRDGQFTAHIDLALREPAKG